MHRIAILLASFAILGIAAGESMPPDEPRTSAAEKAAERDDEAHREGREEDDSFVPSERIGAETSVPFPADI